jgi:ribosomal protein S18 acetylase RimI-like enzyme
MSLYAQYLSERTNDGILETEEGFATFRYLNEKEVYIIDIFVRPELRQSGLAGQLANIIVEDAKKRGCVTLFGTINLLTKGADISLKVLQGYGMRLHSAENNIIVMKKDI